MVNVLRRGSAARMDYIKRFIAVLLALVLCAGLISPPKAEAIVGVDDLTIAAVVLFASSVGVTFTVQAGEATGFNDWLGHKIQDFLTFSGRVLEDFFSSAARSFLSQFGIVRLSSSEASLQAEFLQYLSGSGEQGVEVFDGYAMVDGTYVELTSYSSSPREYILDVSPNFEYKIVPFSSYPAFSITVAPGSTSSNREVTFMCDDLVVKHDWPSTGKAVKYFFYLESGLLRLMYSSNNGGGSYDFPDSISTYISGLINANIKEFAVDSSAIDLDTVNGMGTDKEYSVPVPDVIGWDISDIAGSISDVITGALSGTLEVAGTVADAGEVVVPDTATKVGDIALEDVAKEQESLGAVFVSKFPFCIPWDMYNAVKLLAAPAKTPYWEVDFLAPISSRVGGWRGSTKVVIDMGEYEIIGQLSRWVSTILFCAALISGTKKLIWTA